MPVASRTLYFKNDAGSLWEEPEQYLRLDYQPGPRTEDQLQALLTHARQALRRHGWSKILINQQQMKAFTPSEEDWMLNTWLPLAVQESGYRYGALVLARDVFARLAMNTIVLGSRKLGHLYRSFEHEPEAVSWLLEQK